MFAELSRDGLVQEHTLLLVKEYAVMGRSSRGKYVTMEILQMQTNA